MRFLCNIQYQYPLVRVIVSLTTLDHQGDSTGTVGLVTPPENCIILPEPVYDQIVATPSEWQSSHNSWFNENDRNDRTSARDYDNECIWFSVAYHEF